MDYNLSNSDILLFKYNLIVTLIYVLRTERQCESIQKMLMAAGLAVLGLMDFLSFKTVIRSISIREREREREREMLDKRKIFKKKKQPPAPTASALEPCPTQIKISRTPWHCRLSSSITPRPDHSLMLKKRSLTDGQDLSFTGYFLNINKF